MSPVPGTGKLFRNGKEGNKERRNEARERFPLLFWPPLINKAWVSCGALVTEDVDIVSFISLNCTNYMFPQDLPTKRSSFSWVYPWDPNKYAKKQKSHEVFKELIGIGGKPGVLSTEVSDRSAFVSLYPLKSFFNPLARQCQSVLFHLNFLPLRIIRRTIPTHEPSICISHHSGGIGVPRPQWRLDPGAPEMLLPILCLHLF